MTDLSPAAQAIRKVSERAFYSFEFDCIRDFDCYVAAALEELADQVVPELSEPPCGQDWPWPPAYQQMSDARWEQRQQTRSEILAIAAELRGTAQ